MCGIGGFINTGFNEEHLHRINDSLKHRGPNANGIYFHPTTNLGLAHTRLSIMDLRDEANQPMDSHCKRYKIIYNGEVYNYKKIAKELNIELKTNCDTEVILEAFIKWGIDFVHRLNGMFSIVIYDLYENKLHFFRDRAGIKPLYYFLKNNQLVFASELKAIRAILGKLSLNKQAISNYFHYGYIPKEETIFNNIYKFPTGNYGIFENGELTFKSYWSTETCLKEQTFQNFKHAKDKLNELLFDSIEKRLISDVPIGTFLSGGTDSSIVTAIASKISKSPLNTFSIGFKEAKYNESDNAKKIADYLKTNHHEFIVSEQDILSDFDSIIDDFDEPFADSSCFPTYIVSKLASQHVTVCLSGDGGDELFMGYGSYNWANRLSNPLIWTLRNPISKILSLSKTERKKKASQILNSPSNGRMSHLFSQEQYLFSKKEIDSLLSDFPTVSIHEQINSSRPLSTSEKQSFFDINNYLKDDLLVKVDRMSMLNSLEVRVPLLDYRIIEFALNLDQSLKISSNGTQKFLLKDILKDHIPNNLLDHPKWGFSIPLQNWLKNDLSYLIDIYLSNEVIAEIGIFNPLYVEKLKHRFLSGDNYLYNRIWQIIVFNKFFLNFNK